MNQIELRGHHIKELYRHYNAVLGMLKGEIDSQTLEFNRLVHTPQFSEYVGRQLSKIAFELDVPVIIVEGLDSICSGGCPHLPTNRDTLCLSEDLARADRKELQKYGLKVGKQYRSQDLMDKIHQVNGTKQVNIYGTSPNSLQ